MTTPLESLREEFSLELSRKDAEIKEMREVVRAARFAKNKIGNLHIVGGEGDCSGGPSCEGCAAFLLLYRSLSRLDEIRGKK